MSMAEKKKLSPSEKGRRDLTSLGRKIAIIEQEVSRDDFVPLRADIPLNRAKLRKWESPVDRLWPWKDPQVDSPVGRNAALIARFQLAIEQLQGARRHGKAGLRDDLGHAKKRIAILDQQVADLIGQNRQLRVELSRAGRTKQQ